MKYSFVLATLAALQPTVMGLPKPGEGYGPGDAGVNLNGTRPGGARTRVGINALPNSNVTAEGVGSAIPTGGVVPGAGPGRDVAPGSGVTTETNILIAVRAELTAEIAIRTTREGAQKAGLSEEAANNVAGECEKALGGKSISSVEQVVAYYAAVSRAVIQVSKAEVGIQTAAVFGCAQDVIFGTMGQNRFTQTFMEIGVAASTDDDGAQGVDGCLNNFVEAVNKESPNVGTVPSTNSTAPASTPISSLSPSASPSSSSASPSSSSASPNAASPVPQAPAPVGSAVPNEQDAQRVLSSPQVRDAVSSGCQSDTCRTAVGSTIQMASTLSIKTEVVIVVINAIHSVNASATVNVNAAAVQQFADQCVTGAQNLGVKADITAAVSVVVEVSTKIEGIPQPAAEQVKQQTEQTAKKVEQLPPPQVPIAPSTGPAVNAPAPAAPAPAAPAPQGGIAPQKNTPQVGSVPKAPATPPVGRVPKAPTAPQAGTERRPDAGAPAPAPAAPVGAPGIEEAPVCF
ncbi:hypothetical protein HIM_03520 [Hirsutella minnesotensis 3608]|uniref:Uncharacterized protein n=1 Tax=Hirsutella minnesotensis 3608 TaxID=1043627 RepID=A0A0F8A6J7_9HYPO|nr:hypothetical protein HIM_03520 [Hirsutella minnesotensis 3608]